MRSPRPIVGLRASAKALALGLALFAAACSADRDKPAVPPAYDTDVAPILAAHCTTCHGDTAPAAGWSATSYIGAISCVTPSKAPATLPASGEAPILKALDTDPHKGLLNADERAVIEAWVEASTPASAGWVHPTSFANPRSPGWHGEVLRGKRWAQMLDPNDADACGRCHDGAPVKPAGITKAAPEAPACTTCHKEEGGPLACTTCHGGDGHIYPPRDPCFFPNDAPKAGAHAGHVEASAIHSPGFECSTCHVVPQKGGLVIGGQHGNGSVDIVFDPKIVTPEASYDSTTKTCSVSCHDKGGKRSHPVWTEDKGPMGCNDCHTAPPANHHPGKCSTCHHQANADGTALTGKTLHMNGKVDLGDGSGKCGACHGKGDDPMPSTNAHPSHLDPSIASSIDCSICHVKPAQVISPGHLDGKVEIFFSGRALARDSQPVWDGKGCSFVACHGANLPDLPPAGWPVWADKSGNAKVCGACHGKPPTQHTADTSCDRATCHGSEVSRDAMDVPSITLTGKAVHVDGLIEHGN